jgi:integrase
MRKTYAKNIYHQLNHDLVDTQKALGHASIASTVRYLDADDDRIARAQLAT